MRMKNTVGKWKKKYVLKRQKPFDGIDLFFPSSLTIIGLPLMAYNFNSNKPQVWITKTKIVENSFSSLIPKQCANGLNKKYFYVSLVACA